MKSFYLSLFSFLFLTAGIVAEEVLPIEGLDLATAESRGVTENLSLQIARQELGISEANEDLARSSFIPSLEAGATYQYMDPPPAGKVELIPGFKKGLQMGYSHNLDLGLQAKYVLYAGGRRWDALEAAKLGFQANQELMKDARRGAHFSIRRAYFQAQLAEEAAELSERAHERAKTRLQEADASFRAGVISRLELLRARTAESDFLIQKDETADQKNAAKDALASLLNLSGSDLPPLSDTLIGHETLIRRLDVTALRGIEPGFAKIEAARLAARAMEQKARIAESEYYPTVVAGLRYDILNPYQMEQKTGDRFSAVVQATVPLYDGGENRLHHEIALKEARKAQLQVEDAYRNLMVLYNNLLNRLESLQASLESRKTGIEQASLALEATEVALKNGAATHSEVADAELLLFRMQLTHLGTISDFLINLAQFEQLTGHETGIFPPVLSETETTGETR